MCAITIDNREVWMKALEINVRRGDGNPAFLNARPDIQLVDHGHTAP